MNEDAVKLKQKLSNICVLLTTCQNECFSALMGCRISPEFLQDVIARLDSQGHSSVGWITRSSSGNHSTGPYKEVLVIPDSWVFIYNTCSVILCTHATCTLNINKKWCAWVFTARIFTVIYIYKVAITVRKFHCTKITGTCSLKYERFLDGTFVTVVIQ